MVAAAIRWLPADGRRRGRHCHRAPGGHGREHNADGPWRLQPRDDWVGHRGRTCTWQLHRGGEHVSTSGGTYAPTAASQTVSVPASTSRVPVTVTYAQQNSQIVLTVSGLPGGTSGSVLVTNAFGYSQAVPGSTTLGALAPGLYTIAASSVTSGADTYAPNPASQQVQVTTGQSTSATVTYAISVPGTVNLTIDALTITQSVQSYDDTVPLVANRDAYLRVFVRADQANTATPAVRVRLYQGANPTPVMTYTLPAPGASVPMTVRTRGRSTVPGTS